MKRVFCLTLSHQCHPIGVRDLLQATYSTQHAGEDGGEGGQGVLCVCVAQEWLTQAQTERRTLTLTMSQMKSSQLTCIIIEHSWNILRGKLVRRVAHQHARFSDSPVPDHDALDKSVGLRHLGTLVCMSTASPSLTLWPRRRSCNVFILCQKLDDQSDFEKGILRYF